MDGCAWEDGGEAMGAIQQGQLRSLVAEGLWGAGCPEDL